MDHQVTHQKPPRKPHIIRSRGRFIIDWTDLNGVRHRQSSLAQTEAEARGEAQVLCSKLFRAHVLGMRSIIMLDPGTVQAFYDAKALPFWRETHDATTLRSDESFFRAHFLPAFGPRRISDITDADMIDFQTRRVAEGAAVSTIHRELSQIGSFFGLAADLGLIRKGELPSVPRTKRLKAIRKKIRFLTLEEYTRLLAACGPELRLVVEFAKDTGMRRNEIVTAGRDWIEGDLMNIMGKGRKLRTVALTPRCKEILASLPLSAGRLFPAFSYDSLYTEFKSACKKADVVVKLHELRKTAASWALQEGATMREVSGFLGHSSVTVTEQVYAALDTKNARNVAAAIGRKTVDSVNGTAVS